MERLSTIPEKAPNQEIERKFIIKSLPNNIEQYPHKEIMQGYLTIDENKEKIRLRKKGEKYFKTIKSGSGKVRTEIEEEITEKVFNSLWDNTKGKRIEKTRYEIPNESGIIELDIYRGDLDGLVTAEVEFNNVEDCDKFIPPDWFGEEKTDDDKYQNHNLALHGLPKE
ncbi:MAG: adenylate cyclase [Candidatus Magasanikbacteria bacterium CG10_big_fil_rev_8_21_14_0_10_36_32]|uniref:Adenylate cyclase n=1 Tax=Candidatus Magasanikbacteria bacterium CG10_big_fil_rev_8_21_14_0_10_36_32 TaxID=1974646 RepID=A0A2M6W7J1_9BACT|nr:MAG: adenylate cyclase [Candidatus Magasanikbacteria bacterium CG10_big_fil_rev_8_21_14_0_10_36_32]